MPRRRLNDKGDYIDGIVKKLDDRSDYIDKMVKKLNSKDDYVDKVVKKLNDKGDYVDKVVKHLNNKGSIDVIVKCFDGKSKSSDKKGCRRHGGLDILFVNMN
jgi:tRNA A58 N-methylase Trm61